MVFFGERFISFDEREPEADIPDLKAAHAQYYQADKAVWSENVIRSERDWESWALHLTYGFKSRFHSLLDFGVNIPWLQDAIAAEITQSHWLWNTFTPQSFKQMYKNHPQQLDMLQLYLRPDMDFMGGWILFKDHGRVDEDITCCTCVYLLESASFYLGLSDYQETLH